MNGTHDRFERLPRAIRCRIYALKLDGGSPEEICADPQVCSGAENAGVTLSPGRVGAAFRGREFARYTELRTRHLAALEAEQMTRDILADLNAVESVTDVARYELARSIRGLVTSPSEDDSAEIERVERLARSLGTVTRDETLRLKNEIAALKNALNEKDNLIIRLRELAGTGVSGSKIVEALDREAGVS